MFNLNIDRQLSYGERLDQHIDQYIESVLDSPKVRLNEFLELKKFANLDNTTLLLEVPAEGRVLELLYPDAIIHRADFLKLRVDAYADAVMVTDWAFGGIQRNAYQAVLAVVPMHHANAAEKQQYLAGAWGVLQTGGVLALGEVDFGSPLHYFLDGFINENTITGHKGDYPDARFEDALIQQGFSDVSSQVLACPWVFESEDELVSYMNRLFALKPMHRDYLLNALNDNLGLKEIGGSLHLNWSLRYFRGVKRG